MAYQGQPYELIVGLTNAGTPVTGVLFSGVVVRIKKTGATTTTLKPLTTSDWLEFSPGMYVLKLSASDLDTLGAFYVSLSGAGFDSDHHILDVTPYPVMPSLAPATCVVSGNVVDLGGNPTSFVDIIFRPVKLPAEAGGAFVIGHPIHTKPDAYGSFSVALIRGMQATVDIEWVGIKTQIIIPDAATANLVDLLPPIA